MKILGPGFRDGVGCPMINTHPALLPAFPGVRPVADALAYGVKVTGATVHLVDDGVDTGPVLAQRAVAVRAGDTVDVPARTHQDRGTAAAGEHRRRAGPWRSHRDRTRGDHPVSETNRRPVRRALISVYDKAGLTELAVGLHGLGVEIVSTGSTAQLIADAGRAGRRRSSSSPASRSASTAGSRRCTRTCTPACSPTPAAPSTSPSSTELGIAPFDLLVSNLYPFTATVASGATPGGVRRADRHRRPGHGPGLGEEPRQRGRRRRPRPLRLGARAGEERRLRARRPAAAGRRRVPAHRHLRHRGRVLDGQRAGPRARRRAVPGLGRRQLGPRRPPCATGRTRTRRPRCTSPDARAGRGRAAARQGDVLQQLRRRRRGLARRARPRGAVRRDHQARQPVRHRGRRRHRGRAPQGARHATRSAPTAA